MRKPKRSLRRKMHRQIREINSTAEQVLDSYDARLQRLEDIEAIRRLKAAYCSACDDDHNGEAVAALFTKNGSWHQTGTASAAGNEPKNGRKEISKFMLSLRAAGFIRHSAHIVTNPVINVSGDEADGSWRFIMLYSHTDGSFFRIIGHYEERYVRIKGNWFFRSLIAHVEENGRYLEKEL